ncbi:MAG: hypothetical protein WC787_04800 [Patescibacteria group bacterium]|jgi:hypothetical protein
MDTLIADVIALIKKGHNRVRVEANEKTTQVVVSHSLHRTPEEKKTIERLYSEVANPLMDALEKLGWDVRHKKTSFLALRFD